MDFGGFLLFWFVCDESGVNFVLLFLYMVEQLAMALVLRLIVVDLHYLCDV